jgi:hypothetical protein
MQAMGSNVYVARLTNLTDLELGLQRVKKQAQREGYTYRYQIVGDDNLGYIVVSDVELIPEQRYMQLSDWTQRIIDLYRYARKRIRRSYALGRVSLVPLRRSSNSGQPSSWMRRTVDTEAFRAVEDMTWSDLEAELAYLHDDVFDVHPDNWVSPA